MLNPSTLERSVEADFRSPRSIHLYPISPRHTQIVSPHTPTSNHIEEPDSESNRVTDEGDSIFQYTLEW